MDLVHQETRLNNFEFLDLFKVIIIIDKLASLVQVFKPPEVLKFWVHKGQEYTTEKIRKTQHFAFQVKIVLKI